MKRIARISIVCLVGCLGVPGVGTAASVQFDWQTIYGDLEFGPALGFARIVNQPLDETPLSTVYAPNNEIFTIVDGTFNLTTGPLLEVVEGASGVTYSHAGGGSVSVLFDLELPNGSIHHGTFVAPLGPFLIVDELSDFSEATGFTTGLLGQGLFDVGTATLFGISPLTSGGEFNFYLDFLDELYPERFREGRSYGVLPIFVTPVVPEPALPSLAVMSLAALSVRAGLRKRSSSIVR